eukprot:gene22989-63186_t
MAYVPVGAPPPPPPPPSSSGWGVWGGEAGLERTEKLN